MFRFKKQKTKQTIVYILNITYHEVLFTDFGRNLYLVPQVLENLSDESVKVVLKTDAIYEINKFLPFSI